MDQEKTKPSATHRPQHTICLATDIQIMKVFQKIHQEGLVHVSLIFLAIWQTMSKQGQGRRSTIAHIRVHSCFSEESRKINQTTIIGNHHSNPDRTTTLDNGTGYIPKKQLGLTPGSVFCSCSALWALSADSLSQYVRKAQPVEERKPEELKIKQKLDLIQHLSVRLTVKSDLRCTGYSTQTWLGLTRT